MTDVQGATQGAAEKPCRNGRKYRNDLTAESIARAAHVFGEI